MSSKETENYDYQNTVYGSYRRDNENVYIPQSVARLGHVIEEQNRLREDSGENHAYLVPKQPSLQHQSRVSEQQYRSQLSVLAVNAVSSKHSGYSNSWEGEFDLATGDYESVYNTRLSRLGVNIEHLRNQREHALYNRGRRNVKKKTWRTRMKKWAKKPLKIPLSQLIFLLIFGVISYLLSIGQDQIVDQLLKLRFEKLTSQGYWVDSLIWICWGIVLVEIAILLTKTFAPQAAGSGIPEMKTILSGETLKRFLDFKTLLTKIFGLIFTLSSGLSVGKEGPFVHTSAALCWQMMKLPNFQHWSKRIAAQQKMLGVATAVGVASSFGTPIGGVLFSIEVTSIYYFLDHYSACFIAAITGSTLRYIIEGNALFLTTNFTGVPYSNLEYFAFAFVGVIGGLFGPTFNFCLKMLIQMLRKYKDLVFIGNAFIYGAIVSFITSAAFFSPGEWAREPQRQQTQTLFTAYDLCNSTQTVGVDDWCSPNLYGNLAIGSFIRPVTTLLGITIRAPTGVFSPLLSMGAFLGRLFGETMVVIFPNSGIVPGGYSVVGAAAVAAGVTHTLSSAVIVAELTGQLTYIGPLLVATAIAYLLSSQLTPGVYDVMLHAKRLPYLPALNFGKTNKTACSIMNTNIFSLERNCTAYDIIRLLREHGHLKSYPIIDLCENGYILGSVSRTSLEYMISNYLSARGYKDIEDSIVFKSLFTCATHIATSSIGMNLNPTTATVSRDKHVNGVTLLPPPTDPKAEKPHTTLNAITEFFFKSSNPSRVGDDVEGTNGKKKVKKKKNIPEGNLDNVKEETRGTFKSGKSKKKKITSEIAEKEAAFIRATPFGKSFPFDERKENKAGPSRTTPSTYNPKSQSQLSRKNANVKHNDKIESRFDVQLLSEFNMEEQLESDNSATQNTSIDDSDKSEHLPREVSELKGKKKQARRSRFSVSAAPDLDDPNSLILSQDSINPINSQQPPSTNMGIVTKTLELPNPPSLTSIAGRSEMFLSDAHNTVKAGQQGQEKQESKKKKKKKRGRFIAEAVDEIDDSILIEKQESDPASPHPTVNQSAEVVALSYPMRKVNSESNLESLGAGHRPRFRSAGEKDTSVLPNLGLLERMGRRRGSSVGNKDKDRFPEPEVLLKRATSEKNLTYNSDSLLPICSEIKGSNGDGLQNSALAGPSSSSFFKMFKPKYSSGLVNESDIEKQISNMPTIDQSELKVIPRRRKRPIVATNIPQISITVSPGSRPQSKRFSVVAVDEDELLSPSIPEIEMTSLSTSKKGRSKPDTIATSSEHCIDLPPNVLATEKLHDSSGKEKPDDWLNTIRRDYQNQMNPKPIQKSVTPFNNIKEGSNAYDLTAPSVIHLKSVNIDILTHPDLLVDPSPLQVLEQTPISEIHFLFTMLKAQSCYVVSFGKLTGVVTKQMLINEYNRSL